MNELIIKGKTQIENMEFLDIEGGFGQGRKAMLAKDISTIHSMALKHINETNYEKSSKNQEKFNEIIGN